jgi:hypothetical protein
MNDNDPFGKWWPCLRKHFKRTRIWLPRAKELAVHLNGQRPFRYFTLCARPMIDVFMLVKENVLQVDETERRIQEVSFCELNEIVFPEMIEMLGVEGAGFRTKLEDLTLFSDVPETATLDTEAALEKYVNEKGEKLGDSLREAVDNKRKHLQFQNLFPFDFLNLDFCDPYYEPPDVMRVNSTIDKLLEWQRQPGKKSNGSPFSIGRFVVAITCRVNKKLPSVTSTRLANIVGENAESHAEYKAALERRGINNVAKWSAKEPLDFFMSAWPKEIAKMALRKQWDIKVHDHAFYDRVNEKGETYHIVCLVVEFTQATICSTYLTAATHSLDRDGRTEIKKIEPTHKVGRRLLADLRQVVDLRNEQAARAGREPLPEPLGEINRLRAEGVPI